MAKETEFSLISVSSDDDDVVIQAGVPCESASTDISDTRGKVDSPINNTAQEELIDDAQAIGQGGNNTPLVLSPETMRLQQELEDAGLKASDLDDEARVEFAEHLREQRSRAAEQMLTTEDDLHTKMPFSGMQRAIVIVLFLFVAAFVVYWFVGR